MRAALLALLTELRTNCADVAHTGRASEDEMVAERIHAIELDAAVDKFIADHVMSKPEVEPSVLDIAFGTAKCPSYRRRVNILNSATQWLNTRACTVTAKNVGWSVVMIDYAKELDAMAKLLAESVVIPRAEYDTLKEYKWMYEGLCK